MTETNHDLEAPLYDDPMPWFGAWLAEAKRAEIPEHNACCVSTVDADGQPSGRMVLLKEWGEEGFVFYTNLASRKGEEALHARKASMTFYWRSLGRQIRVEGPLEQVSDSQADAYFATRERGSQIGAWASHQSRPLESRATLERRVAQLEAEYEGRPIPRPPHWSGIRITPKRIEFWAAGDHRLHDRFEFVRDEVDQPWVIQRLNP